MGTTIETREERPLGLFEKYQLSKHLTHAYGNVTLTVELQHPHVENNIEQFYQSSFYPVLAHLIETHPNLSLRVHDELKNTAHFEQLSAIDLSEIVHVVNHVLLDDLIQEECSLEFNLEALLPLWRLKILKQSGSNCSIVFTAHHIIADGLSLSTFWADFTETINKNSTTTDAKVNSWVEVKEGKSVPLPYELSGSPKLSIFSDVVPVLCKNFLPKILPKSIARMFVPVDDQEVWAGDHAAVEGETHKTKLQLVFVDSAIWKSVVDKAKQQGVSGHTILFVSLLLAWARLYPNQTTEVTTPVNARNLCDPPVPHNLIGNFVGGYTNMWTGEQLEKAAADNEKGLWALAKQYYSDLNKNKVEAAKQPLFLGYLPQFPESFCDFWYDKRKNSKFGRSGGLEVSDLGRFAVPKVEGEQRWKLSAMWFCQSSQIFTTALNFNSISINDMLYCTLSWQKGALDEEKIKQFNDIFTDILRKL
ncbi:MAG: alcohol acetyltransferase [Benjaminiella poitrasii]|nr:MAG: alcohol acetyltransferase [Benjaminiella poitrasii]